MSRARLSSRTGRLLNRQSRKPLFFFYLFFRATSSCKIIWTGRSFRVQQLFQEKLFKFIFSCFYADVDRRSIFVGSRIRLINSYDDDDNDDDDDDDNTNADDILKSALYTPNESRRRTTVLFLLLHASCAEPWTIDTSRTRCSIIRWWND